MEMNDLISRKEVIEALCNHYEVDNAVQNATMDECVMLVKNIPSAEPKKGRWIGEGDGYADGYIVYDSWYCSSCDYCYEDDEEPDWNYCPNCGAKMRGVTECVI